MEEFLMILKKLHDKRVTVINDSLKIYVAYQNKTNFHLFCLSNDDPVNK